MADIVVVGAGAAGLTAAQFAARTFAGAGVARRSVLLLDGAAKPGAKILVSGGGRCNVTNVEVTPGDYCGSKATAIRNVLRRFDHEAVRAWMEELGVELKLEPTGKYFPVTDTARTVLEGLQRGLAAAGVALHHRCRVTDLRPPGPGGRWNTLMIESAAGMAERPLRARRVIVATGGLALPKSGSDGAMLRLLTGPAHGLPLAPVSPALTPITLRSGAGGGSAAGRFAELSGITLPAARLTQLSPSGARLAAYEGSTLFTHFGLSGPAPMNLSRHLSQARLAPGAAHAVLPISLAVLPHRWPDAAQADAWLQEAAARSPHGVAARALAQEGLPARLAELLLGEALGGPSAHAPEQIRWRDLTRDPRKHLARLLADWRLETVGDRGFAFAETTAGGIPLSAMQLGTMETRALPGVHLCGEILDVDGRIGGFNFQWAWSSGYVAGVAAAEALLAEPA